jgi:hypothetical protein
VRVLLLLLFFFLLSSFFSSAFGLSSEVAAKAERERVMRAAKARVRIFFI